MTRNRKKPMSVAIRRTKICRELFFCCVMATLVSVLVLGFSYYGCRLYVSTYVTNESRRQNRADQIISELQAYIAHNHLTITNVREIKTWQQKKGVTIRFVGTKDTITELNELKKESENTVLALQEDMSGQRTYEVRFRDQTVVCFPVLDQMLEDYDSLCLFLSGGIAILTFGFAMVILMRRRIRYLILLKEELDCLKAGDLSHEITVDGKDELAQIGTSLNELRESVLEKIRTEREAISANHELITAMSHDLRTPLTRQIGYLEILYRNKYQNEKECREYIEKARNNAFLMRDTTDKLFRYFLAFGQQEMTEKMIEVEGKPLFNAVLKEQIAYIVSQGFVVSFEEISQQFRLRIDADEFSRIFDNVFHNLKKYGEPSVPVYITHNLEKEEFLLMIQNGIKEDTSKVESTKVGLKIVEKVMKSMDGSMEVVNDGQYFIIQLGFRLLADV